MKHHVYSLVLVVTTNHSKSNSTIYQVRQLIFGWKSGTELR